MAQSIVGNAIHKLAAAIAGLLHVFDPEIVILGGQVADAGMAPIPASAAMANVWIFSTLFDPASYRSAGRPRW